MIFIGIGSNLPSSFGDRFKNIDLSISFLEEIGVKLIQKSSFYETLSQPNKNDPKFINVVISVSSILSPIDLMLSLISIEEKLGRKRITKKRRIKAHPHRLLLTLPKVTLPKRRFLLMRSTLIKRPHFLPFKKEQDDGLHQRDATYTRSRQS